MQALILAGGEGTRLRPLTTTIPKPVIPLANRPFISFMLAWLQGHGFDDVVMSCGFLGSAVRSVLGEGEREGVRIRYVDEPEPLGTAGPVKLAEPVLAERFAVLNGDILTDIDLSSVVRCHEERNARVTLTLTPVEDPSSYGVILTDAEGRVEAFIEKPQDEAPSKLINAGIYVLERDVVSEIPSGRAVSFEREVFPSLVGAGLYGIQRDGYWLDIGTRERYLQGTRDILTGAVRTGIEPGLGPGTQVDPEATVRDPVLIGAAGEIAAAAAAGPFVTLGRGCTIGRGAVVRDSALHDGVTVAEDAQVVGSIVGAGAHIEAGARVESAIVGAGAKTPAGPSEGQ
jgi:mannose-1-phosphate guanylyltransferase